MEGERGTTMKTLLTSLILTLALSVNAYAYQIADAQYDGGYNGLDLNTAETLFNNLSPKGGRGRRTLGRCHHLDAGRQP